jgi:hypothetical protein
MALLEPNRDSNMNTSQPTAAVLLIGDEILSGRTKDKNLGFLADYLTALGIDLKEARVVSDAEEEIAAAVNALRSRIPIATTGGIGPTTRHHGRCRGQGLWRRHRPRPEGGRYPARLFQGDRPRAE